MTLPLLASSLQIIATAQTSEIQAVRRPDRIVIDGRTNDAGWQVSSIRLDLRQRDPNEGQPATFNTDGKVVYDDNALYIAAAVMDDAPEEIRATVARRDANTPNDAFTIYIDPQSDGRTGSFFTVGAGATLRDGTHSNDEWEGICRDRGLRGSASKLPAISGIESSTYARDPHDPPFARESGELTSCGRRSFALGDHRFTPLHTTLALTSLQRLHGRSSFRRSTATSGT